MVAVKDSANVRKVIPEKIKNLNSSLTEKFESSAYRFGNELKNGTDTLFFNDKITDISKALDEIYTRYYNRNLGAVVLISDGIYNKGVNPLSVVSKFKNVSFYTVGCGDTVVNKDLILADVLYNKTAFLGNDFPVETIIQAKKMQGTKGILVLKENDREISRREFLVQNNNQSLRISFLVNAKTEGQRKITAEIIPAEGEFTTKNNAFTVYVNVIKNRQKILILAKAPHPDIAAIKYALEASENYSVNSQVYEIGKNYNFAQQNLVILHCLPSGNGDDELIAKLKKENTPVLYIVGDGTGLVAFGKAAGVLNISGSSRNPNNALPLLNNEFTSFTISDKTRQALGKFPPILSPYGDYKLSPGANVFMIQKIGNVKTAYPLIVFNRDNNSQKTGVICGENIWQWKLRDFEVNENNEAFNEIIQKSVQYLSSVENKSNFKVLHKNEFTESESITFDAELFNENNEPINEPDVQMVISDKDKNKFTYTFSRPGNTYHLNAGSLPPGEYTYSATTTYGKRNYEKSGRFIVTVVNNEIIRTEADHRLLYQMAKNSGGNFYTINQTDQLLKDIEKNENVTSVSYSETTMDDLINKKWLIIIPVLLLGLEWFLRKRFGSY